MLKTYRIIPLVFILFLFGFTLITVAPVFAWDPSMGMRHPDRPCMKNAREKGPRFGCGPDMRSPEQIASDPYDTNHPKSQEARGEADSPVPSGETVADSPVPSSPSPSGGEVAELNARIAELEAENARLLAQQGAPADQSGGEVAQLNARIDELKRDLKFSYGNLIDQRCKVNFLKERAVKNGHPNPFHGSRKPIFSCYHENDGISKVGNGKEYSYYFGRKKKLGIRKIK